ncbi:MAG: beta-ketoacyl synthase N-terminal-like domain-containing protein, partial [Desulfomonilaceae bacterium]
TAPFQVSRDKERIAITGMSIVNSLGNSPQEVWAASMALKSGIIEVPASKWPHEKFFDPRPRAPEKTYCKVGAFQNIEVDRKELGIPPQDFRTMTASTRITMWLAQQAIQDSGILESDIPRERIAVLISQNSGEAAATLEDMIVRSAAGRIVDSLRNVVAVSDDTAHMMEEAIRDGRLAVDDTTLLGRLNCTAGGFICNKYGFMGPSFAVSAACATALVALFSAYEMIRNGVIDAAVIGGAEEPLTPMHFLEFSALGALAGLSGVERPPAEYSRPFDATRDGMVLGEGGGMIVIERESVARQRGARIHAYITAMGASNNHLGMVESSRITQEIAIRASFDDAPYGPEGVDLVECHATSTMQGDGEEVLALRNFFGPHAPVVLTSFKSQIGHTLGASGVNSLIRGIMALQSAMYPPTLNYRNPDPEMLLEGSGMTILTEPAEWAPRNGKPRRFQVNAFGFGGSNYVVQIEEAWDDRGYVIPDVSTRRQPAAPKKKLDAPLPSGVQFFTTEIRGRKHRLAVLADTPQDAHEIISSLEPLRQSLPLSVKDLRALAKQGVYLGPADATPKPFSFIFPGQGSHYAGMGLELYETFPFVREWMDKIASVADFDILNLMFYDTEEDLQKTRWQQPALFTMELSLVKYLMALGIHPVALAGHSLGELTALCVSGVYSYEDGFRIVNKRAICMDKACEMNIDPGVMMACDAPLEYLEEIIAQRDNIYITNINSPHQVVIGGNTEAVKQLGEELKAQGYRRTLLRVSMAFHSPIMRCIHDELDAFVSGIQFYPPQIPVISNTTMKPFPSDAAEIRAIIMAHLESPVHWMQNATSLWNDFGVRTFIEVGPRDILTNLVLDTLPEADCIYTCQPSSEVSVFRGAVAQIYVRGLFPFEGDFAPFPGEPHRAAPRVSPKQTGVVPARSAHATLPSSVSPTIFSVIESFVQEGFEKFFKPSLLYAIRRDYDPNFAEADLEQALAAIFPILGSGQPLKPLPAPSAPFVPRVSAAPLAEKPAPPVQAKEGARADNLTEAVIGLIMEATGYERAEIEPSMDLREDLS